MCTFLKKKKKHAYWLNNENQSVINIYDTIIYEQFCFCFCKLFKLLYRVNIDYGLDFIVLSSGPTGYTGSNIIQSKFNLHRQFSAQAHYKPKKFKP